ncbi:uncharacterized protein [Dendrobates tinctorius]|uniref:uncharacterized protein isoform X2 n=1 Tax=Dendrobates tinctorius TaxID=92724 RepID=UPI003CC9AE7F
MTVIPDVQLKSAKMRKLKKRLPLRKVLKEKKRDSLQTLSEFDDIAVYFSSEEWGSLEESQKELYRQVMMDNYQTYTSGQRNKKPKLISCLERGKDPSITSRGRHVKPSACCKKSRRESGSYGERQHIATAQGTPGQKNLFRTLLWVSLPDASNNRTDELNTSLFTPDGLTVEGIHLRDDIEEDSLTTKRRYNFRNIVRVEYAEFFDNEIRELKRKKGVRVKLSCNELEPRIDGLYTCSECGKTYKQKSSLAKHQKLHTGMSYFICMKCDKCFTHRCILRRHERIHMVKKPFSCPDCEKRFTDSSALQKHQRLHTGYKPYKCPECDKTFSISNYLILHQRTHTGEKPYVCDKCGKSFTQSSHLTTHKRIHTGIKPYGCIECGKGFSTSSHLITHQRNHTGERPYKCEECGVAFKHSTHLVLHRRKHTGEKPFSCDKCTKKFSQRGHFLKHQKKWHVDE